MSLTHLAESELRIPKLNLASDFCCMEARPVSKILLGTIGMSKMSISSLSDRFVRLSHVICFCNTIIPIDFPVSWTVQHCMRRQMSMITVISSHTFWALAASHSSAW